MIIDVAICTKAHKCQFLTLVEGKKYDVSKCEDGGIFIFIKDGWFKLIEWSENLTIIDD